MTHGLWEDNKDNFRPEHKTHKCSGTTRTLDFVADIATENFSKSMRKKWEPASEQIRHIVKENLNCKSYVLKRHHLLTVPLVTWLTAPLITKLQSSQLFCRTSDPTTLRRFLRQPAEMPCPTQIGMLLPGLTPVSGPTWRKWWLQMVIFAPYICTWLYKVSLSYILWYKKCFYYPSIFPDLSVPHCIYLYLSIYDWLCWFSKHTHLLR